VLHVLPSRTFVPYFNPVNRSVQCLVDYAVHYRTPLLEYR